MTEPRVNKTLKMWPAEADPVQELADAEQRTWSAMARILLAEAIEARQRHNPGSTITVHPPTQDIRNAVHRRRS